MSAYDDPNARMCFRKKAMPENHARKVAARAEGLRAYQCPLCCYWHVTNDLDQDGQPKGRLSAEHLQQKGHHHAEEPEQ